MQRIDMEKHQQSCKSYDIRWKYHKEIEREKFKSANYYVVRIIFARSFEVYYILFVDFNLIKFLSGFVEFSLQFSVVHFLMRCVIRSRGCWDNNWLRNVSCLQLCCSIPLKMRSQVFPICRVGYPLCIRVYTIHSAHSTISVFSSLVFCFAKNILRVYLVVFINLKSFTHFFIIPRNVLHVFIDDTYCEYNKASHCYLHFKSCTTDKQKTS